VSAFTGFSQDTVQFLTDLHFNNDKAWFDANRPRYEEHWLAAGRAFVEAAGEALAQIAPDVVAEPKVNGSLFRINRDTRFSNDKTPYKDHLDVWMWDGCARKEAATGFFLRVTPDDVGIGVGAHGFDKERLARYRDLVVNPASGGALRGAVAAVTRAGMSVEGEQYKRLPKGFEEPADPESARLLRFGALWAHQTVEHPPAMSSRRFVSWCLTRWRKQLPIHEWLRDNLQ